MKIAAAAVVLVMLASAMIIGINATQYDAEGEGNTDMTGTEPTYTAYLKDTDATKIVLNSNINYYYQLVENGDTATNITKKVDVSWKTGTTKTDDTISGTPQGLDITPNVEGVAEKKLTVTLKKTAADANVSTQIFIEATVKVIITETKNTTSPGTGAEGADSPGTVTTKKIETTVTEQSIMYKIVIKSGTNEHFEFSATFVKNVYSSKALTDCVTSDNANDLNNYRFYSPNLPEGLSMTPDGKISGIAKELTTKTNDDGSTEPFPKTVTIHMENTDTGGYATGHLSLSVVDFEYEVYSGTYAAESDNSKLPKVGDSYYIDQKKTFSIVIDNAVLKASGANYISIIGTEHDLYKTIDITIPTELNAKSITSITDYTKGTGVYKICIGHKDSTTSNILASFDLYVIGNVVGVGSTIIVGSK